MGCGAVLRGRVVDGRLAVAGAAIEVPGADGPACFAIRPEHVALDCDAPLRLRVAEARHAGTHGRLLLVGVGIEVVAHAAGDALPDVGTTVGVELPPARLWRIPAGDADAVRAIEVTA